MRCPASLLRELEVPNTSSVFADEGTAAHEFGSMALSAGYDRAKLKTLVGELGVEVNGHVWALTEEMADYVADYVDVVNQYLGSDGMLAVEQRVEFSSYINQPDSFGTSDAIVIHDGRITIIDLKYGMGVRVDAEQNEQMMLYALGSLASYGLVFDFANVTLVVCQPRLQHVSEWTLSVEDLLTFGEKAAIAAAEALQANDNFVPGDKQCQFCRIKADCPGLRNLARQAFDGLEVPADAEPDHLADAMSKVELIEQWCSAVRKAAQARLLMGKDLPGYKLVEGRKGNRQWTDSAAAESVMKAARLKVAEMYDLSLISPTTAEKRIKETSPKRWEKLEALITRKDGTPAVVPASDKRPALDRPSAADAFAGL